MALASGSSSSNSRTKPLSIVVPSTSSTPSHIALKTDVLDTFKPSKVFGDKYIEEKANFTSLCFDDRGEQLLSAGEDEKLQIWNCTSGRHTKKLYSKKYGVDLARFTHDSDSIIYASTKADNTIRLQSVPKNIYLQYFKGHESKVTSLEMSPVDDTFLSAAKNESVRLWDKRTSTCQGLFPIEGHPVVAIDPDGVVFAIALNEHAAILLYDLRIFTNKPFMIIYIDDSQYHSQISMPPRIPIITSLAFSPSGIGLLVGTAGNVHYVVESHRGFLLHRLRGHEGLEKGALAEGNELGMVTEAGISGQECGWTPDGRFVYSGAADGMVRFWHIPDYTSDPNAREPDLSTLLPSSQLSGHPAGPARVVRFNPRLAMFASASSQVALWLPDLDDII